MKRYKENMQSTGKKQRTSRYASKLIGSGVLVITLAAAVMVYQSGQAPASSAGSGTHTSAPESSTITANADPAEWNLILVNKWNSLPEGYETNLIQLEGGESVDERIYPSLQEMFDAARADGVYPIVASGHRTTASQKEIMDNKIAAYEAEGYSREDAKTEAEAWVAIPGTSEHQLGISIDINADGINSYGEEVYTWLNENGYRYGFIRRYPPEKTEITGISNEPWHYRYVGVAAAAEMYRQGLCLEEYLKK